MFLILQDSEAITVAVQLEIIAVATLRNVRVQRTELTNQKPLLQLLIIVGAGCSRAR